MSFSSINQTKKNMKKVAVLFAVLQCVVNIQAWAAIDAPATSGISDKQFFIENKGQWPQDVLYLTQIGGLDAWITQKGIVYDFYQLNPTVQNLFAPTPEKQSPEYARKGHVIRWTFNGSNEKPGTEGIGRKTAYYNYFIGADPSGWASNVGLFEEVIVKNVYTGIDARYYFDNKNIRYDYIVHPGADVGAIRLTASGTESIRVDANGDLKTRTCLGEVTQGKLFAYQIRNGSTQEVSCDFTLSGNTLGFAIGEYDNQQVLIIDPLIWGTYIGGTSEEGASGLARDGSDNLYVTGSVYSTTYPTTVGAYDLTQNGSQDAYVTKLNASGTALIYSTFLGGSGTGLEQGYAITVDANGNAYVTGNIGSGDFPTTPGAFDVSANGTDVFVTKLNATGTALVYSTFMGGNGQDFGLAIAIDATGNAYVTGYTNSGNFPVTVGVYDPTFSSSTFTQDVFVSKLNATASVLIFSTYLGGYGSDYGNGIAVDASGNVYVTGSCSSAFPLFPTTSGAFDQTQGGGDDVYVAKLNSTATTLVFSTYIGGTTNDAGTSIAVDSNGDTYIGGYTASVTFPITIGVFDQVHNGGIRDAFVTKLNAAGSTLLYSTFVGGTGDDRATSIGINSAGNVYLCGITTSVDMPTTSGSFDQTSNGGWDGFVAQLSPTFSALGYGSYYGGTGNDYINALQTDASGSIYIAGGVASTDVPTTIGAYDVTYNGGTYDVAVAKFCTPPTISITATTPLCAGQTLNLSTNSGASYTWSGPNSFSSSLQSPSIPNVTTANSGTYSVIVNTSGGCSGTASLVVTVNSAPVATASSTSPVCAGQTLSLTSGGGASYSWSGPNGFTSPLQNPTISSVSTAASGTYSVIVTGASGCTSTGTVSVVINSAPVATASSNAPVCEGQAVNLSAGGGVSYLWSGPNSFSSPVQNPSLSNVTSAQAGTYSVTVTNANGCTNVATVAVNINVLPVVTVGSNSPVCVGQALNLVSGGGSSYAWSGPVSFSASQQNTSISNTVLTNAGAYTVVVTDANGCSNSGSTSVVINSLPAVIISSNSPVCVGQPVNLTSGGGTVYTWVGPNTFSSTQQNPIISNSTVSDAGTYSVTVTDGNGCIDSAVVTVALNALPNATASSNSPVCEGQPINFTSAGGTTYSWSGPGSFSTPQQNPVISNSTFADAGTYTVAVTDINGCSNTATVSVVVNGVFVNISSNSPVCDGSALMLTSSAGGGITYSWSGPDNFTSTLQNPGISNVNSNGTGVYTVTVTATNGCSDTASVNVQVNTVNAGATANGAVLTATAVGATYQWIDCVTLTPIANETGQTFTPSQNGQYAVVVTENGCTDTSACLVVISAGINDQAASGNVVIYPNPADNELFVLSGLQVKQLVIYSATGTVVMNQQTSATTVNVSGLAAGIYFIDIETDNGITRHRFIKN